VSEALVTGALVHLFDAAVRFTSEPTDDAVVLPDKRESDYLGNGDGFATGERLRGRLGWSFYAGNSRATALGVRNATA
jgi:hypothetical protein